MKMGKETKTALEKWQKRFLEYLEIEKNRSPLTLRNYDHYLERFCHYSLGEGISSPTDIDLDLVRGYRIFLNRHRDKDGAAMKLITQNYHIIALRSFLKYLAKCDVPTLAAEKIELPKIPSRQVEYLEKNDVERLLSAPDQESDAIIRLRDKAVLELLFSTGLRVGELATLKRRQINLDKDEFSIKGKGDKIRMVFLSERAKKCLTDYLKTRRDNSPALFVRHNRQLEIDDTDPLTARTIQRLVKKYALLSGVSPTISPHTLRHTMATDLLTAGADLRAVQEILGHSSITTTQIYTHVTNRRLREIHHKYHGKFRSVST